MWSGERDAGERVELLGLLWHSIGSEPARCRLLLVVIEQVAHTGTHGGVESVLRGWLELALEL